VNQNLPPNPPGQNPGDYPSGDPSGQNNPYYAAAQQQQPDLDAGAPTLAVEDGQRINKRAIAFLGGIVLLLVLMTVLVLMRPDEPEEKEVAEKPREQKVQIEDFDPNAAPLPPPTPAPIPLEGPPPEELPPLPPEQPPQQANGKRGGGGGGGDQDERDRGPTLAERRMGQGRDASAGPVTDPALQAALVNQQTPQAGGERRERVNAARFLNNPDALLVRGTYVRCVMETRIVTDIPGFASCVVTEPVYSINGRKLLLPKGTKISGQYSGEPNGPRVAVIWDRAITPTGIDVNLASPGVDNLGGAGHPGDYDGHWFSKMSAALMISLLADGLEYAAAKNGPTTTTTTSAGTIVEQPFESKTADTMERLANSALNKAIARPATVTINQGTMLNIYVAQDVDFSAVVGSR